MKITDSIIAKIIEIKSNNPARGLLKTKSRIKERIREIVLVTKENKLK